MVRAAGLDDDLAEAIWAHDADDAEANYPFPDAEPVMRALHEHGLRVAIVSDIHYDIRDHFARHGLDGYVDAYVLSFEHGIQKPDARGVHARARGARRRADRALMVGDRASHDGAATAVGIATYIFCRAVSSRDAPDQQGLDAVLRLARIS